MPRNRRINCSRPANSIEALTNKVINPTKRAVSVVLKCKAPGDLDNHADAKNARIQVLSNKLHAKVDRTINTSVQNFIRNRQAIAARRAASPRREGLYVGNVNRLNRLDLGSQQAVMDFKSNYRNELGSFKPPTSIPNPSQSLYQPKSVSYKSPRNQQNNKPYAQQMQAWMSARPSSAKKPKANSKPLSVRDVGSDLVRGNPNITPRRWLLSASK